MKQRNQSEPDKRREMPQSTVAEARIEESLQEVQESIQTLMKTRVSELAANQGSTPTREAIIDFAPMGMQLERSVHDIAGMEQILRQQ